MNTTANKLSDELVMYQANKRAYEKQIDDLSRVVKSKILSASIFFTCSERQGANLFSHQVLYSGCSNIPPEICKYMISLLPDHVHTVLEPTPGSRR